MEKTCTSCHCASYGAAVLRMSLGLLFLLPGLGKLMNPAMIAGMLGGLGFPAPAFFGWLLLLSEIVFGAWLIAGWKVKYAVWPLMLVLVVATLTVHLAKVADPMGMITVLFHVVGIAGLVSVFLTGAGAWSLEKQ